MYNTSDIPRTLHFLMNWLILLCAHAHARTHSPVEFKLQKGHGYCHFCSLLHFQDLEQDLSLQRCSVKNCGGISPSVWEKAKTDRTWATDLTGQGNADVPWTWQDAHHSGNHGRDGKCPRPTVQTERSAGLWSSSKSEVGTIALSGHWCLVTLQLCVLVIFPPFHSQEPSLAVSALLCAAGGTTPRLPALGTPTGLSQ